MQNESKTTDESKLVSLSESELVQVTGGASIYVDGSYWGDGNIDFYPWPHGIPVKFYP